MKKTMWRALIFALALCLSAGSALAATVSEPGVYPITEEDVTISIWTGVPGSVEDFATNAQSVWYEAFSGVKVDWIQVNSSEMTNKFNLSIASGDYADIYMSGVGTADILQYAEDGVVIPLNDLIDAQGYYIQQTFAQYPDVREQITAPDGNIYELFNIRSMNYESARHKMWVYKEWLAAYEAATGKGVPATAEEFKDLLVYFRDNDMNGNGDPNDEIPLTGNYQYWSQGSDPLFYLMGAFTLVSNDFMLATEDGQIYTMANTDDFRAGLSYVHDLYAEGLLAEETYVQDLSQFRALTSAHYDTVVVGAAAAPYPFRLLTMKNEENSVRWEDYVTIEPLMRSDGVRETWATLEDPVSLKVFVTTACEEPEVAIKWLDFWYSEEGKAWNNYGGQEGVDWAWVDEPSFGGAAQSVKLLYVKTSVQNAYWDSGWVANIITSKESLSVKAASDTYTDNELAALVADEVYHPYKVYTNFPTLVWSTDIELYNEMTELKGMIVNYIIQSCTQFTVGALDIADDAAWDTYKAELDAMGLEHLFELMHAYYFG